MSAPDQSAPSAGPSAGPDSAGSDAAPGANFVRAIVASDIAAGKNGGAVVTRFPPEPNGYLHIGHAKSICLNFGVAGDNGGRCNLRFDDTNPVKEDVEYVEAIERDVEWLGFEYGDAMHASDYFGALYEQALELVRRGLAYVDSSSAEEMREMRGTLTAPGVESPYRNRGVEQNIDLFERMKAGDFAEGEHVLRARIDMASGNINLRDPTLYRIRRAAHVRTGTTWSIYPMYDYTHCLSDSFEGITHSLCTLEFEDHRPLYDWVLDVLGLACHPQQIEFARLQLEYTILSKRKLIALVADGHVDGWDDPRMPTLVGLRRRGFTPAAIREFCTRIGVTKSPAWIDAGVLEGCVRDDLNAAAPRRLGVLDPLRLVITTLPADHDEALEFQNHPQDDSFGTRTLRFTRELYVERDDWADEPPPKWQRLVEGGEVRLRGAWVVRVDEVVRDAHGRAVELRCSHDPDTLGQKPVGRKVKGVIHWVSATHGVRATVRSYDRLFTDPRPDAAEDPIAALNPASVIVHAQAVVEPGLAGLAPEAHVQFERLGYFVADRHEHSAGSPTFNRTVTLRDTWAK